MMNIYDTNGLPFWTEPAIMTRRALSADFALMMREALWAQNRAFSFHEIEAPCLISAARISPEYDNSNVFFIEKQLDDTNESQLVLRPETTPASYAYADYLLKHQVVKPPLVVWQVAKSFRREQDQPSKHMRLKEFYQQEFQCFFTDDTANDYMAAISHSICDYVGHQLALPARLIPSDRLPSYSRKTLDVEVENPDKWMEVVSISLREDVPFTAQFSGKGGVVEKKLLNLEVAIGLDRCVYNRMRMYEGSR